MSLRQLAGYLCLFTLLAFFFALGPYFLAHRKSTGPVNFWVHFHNYGIRYIPWGFLVPVVVFMARQFSLIGKDWPYSAVVHLAASISLVFLHLAAAVLLNRALLAAGLRHLPVLSFSEFAAAHFNQGLLSYWLIAAVAINIDSYRKFRDREIRTLELEAQLVKAQMQSLKVQINPHFLFNTLHLVSGLVYRDPKEADAVLARLGRLIRSHMELSEDQEIPMESEMALLNAYTDIMIRRFGDRLKVALRLDEEVRNALLPCFLLQPLVENSIRHGIGSRIEGGKVWLEAGREGESLVLRVADDGVGFSDVAAVSDIRGTGLANLRKRLELIYGDRQTMTLGHRPGGGAEVVITLPFREGAENESEGGSR